MKPRHHGNNEFILADTQVLVLRDALDYALRQGFSARITDGELEDLKGLQDLVMARISEM